MEIIKKAMTAVLLIVVVGCGRNINSQESGENGTNPDGVFSSTTTELKTADGSSMNVSDSSTKKVFIFAGDPCDACTAKTHFLAQKYSDQSSMLHQVQLASVLLGGDQNKASQWRTLKGFQWNVLPDSAEMRNLFNQACHPKKVPCLVVLSEQNKVLYAKVGNSASLDQDYEELEKILSVRSGTQNSNPPVSQNGQTVSPKPVSSDDDNPDPFTNGDVPTRSDDANKDCTDGSCSVPELAGEGSGSKSEDRTLRIVEETHSKPAQKCTGDGCSVPGEPDGEKRTEAVEAEPAPRFVEDQKVDNEQRDRCAVPSGNAPQTRCEETTDVPARSAGVKPDVRERSNPNASYVSMDLLRADGQRRPITGENETRPTLVIFSKYSCTRCTNQVKALLAELQNTQSPLRQVRIVSVLIEGDQALAKRYRRSKGIPWEVGFNTNSSVYWKYCQTGSLPCVVMQTPRQGIILQENAVLRRGSDFASYVD